MWKGPEARFYRQAAERYTGLWGEEPESEGDALSVKVAARHADAAAAPFSPLDLRDRVVIMLLFDQVVREEQVELAWQLWHQMDQMEQGKGAEPLWRVLTLFPDLDRDLVYAEAARVYGFEEARIVRETALPLIKEIEARLTSAQWDELTTLRTVPIHVDPDEERVCFATQDPTRPELHRLVDGFGLGGYRLQYAREQEIIDLLVESFPQRYSHLKELSGLSKDLLMRTPGSLLEDPIVIRTSLPDLPKPEKPEKIDEVEIGEAEEDRELEMELDEASAEVLRLFDEVLAEAVQRQATDVCLLASPLGVTDVYFQVQGDLQRRRVVEEPPPDRLRAIIKKEIILAEECTDGRIHKQVVERHIDDRTVRFRVAVVPPSDQVQSECVVVHVLD